MEYVNYLEKMFHTKVRQIKKIPAGYLTYDYTDPCGFMFYHSHKPGSHMRYAAYCDIHKVWYFFSFRFSCVIDR